MTEYWAAATLQENAVAAVQDGLTIRRLREEKEKVPTRCRDFKVTRGTFLRFGLTEYLIASRAAVKVLAFFEKLPPCLVGIEACASSHHWSRELQALGHTVRLMPPAYVKPYVKRLLR